MADTKLALMTAASALSGADLFYTDQSGDRKATGTQIKALVLAGAITTLGAADAAAPVAQTLNVQNVVAGTLNTAGAALTISGSQGTGTGAGGSIVFKTAPVGGSGTSQNALATAMTIDSKQQLTFPGIWNGSDLNILFANACGFGSINNEIRVVRGGFGFFSLDTGAGQLVVKGSSGTYGGSVGFGIPGNPIDCQITGIAANTVQLGATDAAAPVAQTLTVQSVVAGTSNTAGANFTIAGSKGTGTGAGGSIVFQTAPAGGSSTSQNALVTRLTLNSAGLLTGDVNVAASVNCFTFQNSAKTNTPGISYSPRDGASILHINQGNSGGGLAFEDFNGRISVALGTNANGFNATYDWSFQGTNNTVPGDFGPGTDNALNIGDATHNVKAIHAYTVKHKAVTFANVPASPVEGMVVAITDSTASSGGTVITGGGSNHVLGYYTGTNWVVASGTGSGGGGLAVGSTAISGGTTKRLLFDNAGVVGETTLITDDLRLDSTSGALFGNYIDLGAALGQAMLPQITAFGATSSGLCHTLVEMAAQNVFVLKSSAKMGWSSTGAADASTLRGGLDTILTRNAAATLQMGQGDAAAPVAQTLTVQSVVAGTSNIAGADFTISGSKGTGTGAGGSIVFKTALAGSTGTSQNAPVTVATLDQFGSLIVPGDGTGNNAAHVQYSLSGVNNGFYGGTDGFAFSQGGVPVFGLSSFWNTGISIHSTWILGWNSGNAIATAPDTVLRRAAAATLALGNVDAAAPVAQTLQVQSVVAGTSNTAGQNFTINGSKGTGTGAGGSIVFQTAAAGSTGTSQNALLPVLTLNSSKQIVGVLNIFNNTPNFTSSNDLTTGITFRSGEIDFISGGNRIGYMDPSTGLTLAGRIVLGGSGINGLVQLQDTSGNISVITPIGTGAFQFGQTDAAAPVAQTLQVQSVIAGTASGTVGQNFTINGSKGTGTGAGGSIIFQTAAAGGVSTAQNALAPALTLNSAKLATFSGNVDVQSGTTARMLAVYNTYSSAGANYERGVMDWTANSNVLTIGTQNAGTGVARNLMFIVGGGTQLDYGLSTASKWSFGSGVNLFAGTSSNAPLTFQNGTLLGTAAAGALEYDGKVHYATSVASARQILNAEQVQNLTVARTFTNNTSAQAIFNATTNGALTLAASTTYEFEMLVAATGFSATAHTLNFGFGGTATFTSIGYFYDAQAGSTLAGPAASFTGFVAAAAATPIIASNTTTGLVLRVRGTMRINAGGTVIPQLTQVTASAAAVVQVNSFFRCWPAGSDTTASVGNWS